MRYHEYMLKGDKGGQEYINDAGERFWVDTVGNATSLDTGYRFMCNFFADDAEALYGSVRPVFRDNSDLDLVEAVKGYTKYKDSEGSIYYVDAFGGVTDETGYVYTIGFYDADAARLFYDLVPVDDEYVEEDKDQVNHPSHYNEAGVECIEAIRASLGPIGFQAYCKGNCMKYLWRYEYKNGLEDLKKAQVYLNWMVESKEGEGTD